MLLLATKTDDVSNEIVTILAADDEIRHFGVGGLKKHSKRPLVKAGKPRKDAEWRCLEARRGHFRWLYRMALRAYRLSVVSPTPSIAKLRASCRRREECQCGRRHCF